MTSPTGRPSADDRSAEREAGTRAAREPERRDGAIEVRNLTKRYGRGDSSVEALSSVSLSVRRGSITGLLGTNGAGKTTLLKSILGLVAPTAGTVRVEGVDVGERPLEAHRAVAAVFEGARNVYWRLTPRENVSFFARLHGVSHRRHADRVRRAIDAAGIAERADAPVTELSRGMKQRCSLACALVRETPILLLDEPTLGLDVDSREALLDELVRLTEREGRTVLLSSHDMDVIERVCDRVAVVNDGALVADASVEALKAAFETRTCTVTLETAVSADAVAAVDRSFDARNVTVEGGRTRFDVVLPGASDVYDLVAGLREDGLPLRSIERADPNVGEIFASITADGRPAPPDDRAVPEGTR